MFLTADEIARLYDISSVLGTDRHKMLCPLPDHTHTNYTPSFSVFFSDGKQRWRCHGCGRSGDVIDLVGYLHVPGYEHDEPQKVKTAINLLTGGGYSVQPVLPPPPEPTALYQGTWKAYLPPGEAALRYMATRHISDVGAHHYLGQLDEAHARYLTIPCFHDGVLQGIKLRLIEGQGTRYKSIKGSRGGLFNHDWVREAAGTVFVVKGEIAAMVMESFGYSACAPTTGENGDVSPFITALVKASRIVVVGDNDAHVNSQVRMSTQRRAAVLGAELIYPPECFKDVDEWLLAEPVTAREALNKYVEER